MKHIIYCFLVAIITARVLSVDEESLKERRCIPVQSSPDIDWKWFHTVEKWYFPMLSKAEFYLAGVDFLDKRLSDIPESVVKEPCITCDSKINCIGYGSKTSVGYDVSIDENFVFKFKGKSKYSMSVTHVITLTDNKNFAVGVSCWEDDEASFGVWTSTPDPLSAESKSQILDHLKKLGFDSKFYLEIPCFAQLEDKTEL